MNLSQHYMTEQGAQRRASNREEEVRGVENIRRGQRNMTRGEFREELRRANDQAQVDQERKEWWDRERRNRTFWDLKSLSGVALILALVGTVLYMGLVLLVGGLVLLSWPYTIREMIQAYQGGFSMEGPALTALLAILAVMLLRNIKETRATARAPWKRYMLLSTMVTALIGQCMSLSWGMATMETLLSYAANGFVLSLLPSLILYYVEFRTRGYRRFAPMLAAEIRCRVKGEGTTFLVMGILVLILALLMLVARLIEQPGATWGMVLMPLSVSLLSFYIAKAKE